MSQERPSILFIVNPTSGTKEKSAALALATKVLAGRYDLRIQYTTHRGHARQLAAEAVSEGISTVVAVGGDGTVNEVASALIHTDTALGIIPVGSGNGLARDLGLVPPLHLQAIEAIKTHKTKLIDYGIVNGQPFFCTCGFGFDATVSREFSQKGKRGFFKYLYLTVREFFRYHSQTCEITHDGQTVTREAFMINCANIRQFGFNAYIAPHADFTDGLMNVTILKPFGLWGAVRLAWRLFLRKIDRISLAETFTCEALKLTLPPGAPFHYDGDPVQLENPVDIRIIRQGLKVIFPEHRLI